MDTLHGALCFSISTDVVSLFVTREGGHVAPVEFSLGGRVVSPYALAPWEPAEVAADLPVLLKNLRGDFFCFPFGPQAEGPPHGECANGVWELVSREEGCLVLEMEAADVGGKIIKSISLIPGQTAVYYEHRIEGVEGDFNYGTHPVLDLSGVPEGEGRISVSPFRWGSVYPEWFSHPDDGARQALEIGGLFAELEAVPLMDGGKADVSAYPARAGTDDLVMMVSREATPEQPFAWAAVVMDGYVWFSLKNPADFPATMLWLSNGGRSAAPWESRHTGRLGVEDVCSHFCDGVEISRRDLLRNLAIPTSRAFSRETAVVLRNIHAVAEWPEDFGKVESIVPDGADGVLISDGDGNAVRVEVEWRRVIGLR